MYRESLKKYLDDLASRKPAPGGGSAAALEAAIGAALISMAANFTIGNNKYKEFEGQAKEILRQSEKLRQKFMQLVDEDVKGYKKLGFAYKMPKKTAVDEKKRAEKMQEGLKQATVAPVDICKCAYEAIQLCRGLVQKGNVNLITDVAIASAMLHGAFGSALLNVEINLKSLKDEKFIAGVREILEPMEAETSAINEEISKEVQEKIAA